MKHHLIKNQSPQPTHGLNLVALLCLSVFPSVGAYAQTNTSQFNEVIVQSGRLEQKQFDTPGSIYTVDSDTIRSSGPQVNISDVLNRAPGVVALIRNNPDNHSTIPIRRCIIQRNIKSFQLKSSFSSLYLLSTFSATTSCNTPDWNKYCLPFHTHHL